MWPHSIAIRLIAVGAHAAVVMANLSFATELVDLGSFGAMAQFEGVKVGDDSSGRAACDVNGDGLEDLLIGAHESNGPSASRPLGGAAYLLYGRRGRWSGLGSLGSDADVTIYGQQSFDSLGWDIACADINNDGFADIVMDAPYGDSVNDTRVDAGQVHIVFGSASLGDTIDLLSAPSTTIWGAGAGHHLGQKVATGDLNGDGTADLILSARNTPSRSGTGFNVGRVYVLFGRPAWPSTIDLLTTADVVLYGKSSNDFFSSDLHLGDLDRDGLVDLVVGAAGGDGPGDTRTGCGEAHVFRGRTAWPAFIDLVTSNADSMLYGADAGDQVASGSELDSGDLNLDGTADLAIASGTTGGRPNNLSAVGEVRSRAMGSPLPTTVDLRMQQTSLIYGANADDLYCTGTLVTDVDGNRIRDLVCTGPYADGPDETRLDAGEIAAVHGRASFPVESDFKPSQADLIIYGGQIEDELALGTVTDLNGDRDPEIVASIRANHDTLKPRVIVLSTIDRDGDAVLQLSDNCPLVWNPAQTDADADLIGDACDGDYDGDGLSDELDCAPNLAAGGRPSEVSGVSFEPGSLTRLVWSATPFADRYDLSGGPISSLDGNHFGQCLNATDPILTDTIYDDPSVPGASQCRFYLVRARDLDCPAIGTWGNRSDGLERINSDPTACP